MRTLWGQIFRILSTLSSCKSCRSTRSICTHQAHHTYMLKIVIFDISCAYCVPMCVYNVPVVCTYFIVRTTSTSNVSAFRERVPIVYTTKTRLCNCISIFLKNEKIFEKQRFRKKRNASFKSSTTCNTRSQIGPKTFTRKTLKELSHKTFSTCDLISCKKVVLGRLVFEIINFKHFPRKHEKLNNV